MEENRNRNLHFTHKKSHPQAATSPDTTTLMGDHLSRRGLALHAPPPLTVQNPAIRKIRCKEAPFKLALQATPM